MTAYYNEIDPYAAQWLRNLIAAGHIAAGDVDERDIRLVHPTDLIGYTQCHFFAGIGGWSYALRLAGWPDERPVWTGSCPCQPFSAAGKGEGTADARHLWPDWFRLVRECRPVRVYGEQVAAAIRHGWLDLVSADLEGAGYTLGAAVVGAHSVGAPHIRQRLWFVADRENDGRARSGTAWAGRAGLANDCNAGDLGHATSERPSRGPEDGPGQPAEVLGAGHQTAGELADSLPAGRPAWRAEPRDGQAPRGSEPSDMGDADDARPQGRGLRLGEGASERAAREAGATVWSSAIWLPCADGKARPVEPTIFPLAHGVSGRVGQLRAAGNAIVPQVAAEFIAATICPTQDRAADKEKR